MSLLPKKAPAPDPVADAREVVAQWRARVAELEAAVEGAERRLGDEALDAGEGGDVHVAERLVQLRAQLDAARKAVEAAEARVLEARKAVALEEAQKMRAEAEELFAQADDVDRTVVELIRQIEAFEECDGGVSLFPVRRSTRLRSDARRRLYEADRREHDAAGVPMPYSITTDVHGMATEYRGR